MNKKYVITIFAVGVLIAIFVYLLFPVCKPCEYKGQNEVCTLECNFVSRWKVLLFELTGIRTG